MSDTKEDAVSHSSVASQQSPYSVHLEFFNGPMDLLLHLVQQREVPIEKVDLSDVCEQYVKIISETRFLDLERAGEYLVIAATLTALKSQSLLPDSSSLSSEEEEEFDSDFFATLRERLIAYEETKRLAISLQCRPQLGINTFGRPARAMEIVRDEEYLVEGDADGLSSLFLKVLKRIGKSAQAFRVRMEPISIVSCMMKIIDRLSFRNGRPGDGRNMQSSRFLSLVAGLGGSGLDGVRGSLIGGFLAVLELARRGVVHARQTGDSARDIEIELRFVDADTARSELVRRFDDFDDQGLEQDEIAALETPQLQVAGVRG
jgi:segregation and condensation protein A